MIRVYQTTEDLDGEEGRGAVRTGLAFALAPGIAALVGCAVLAAVASVHQRSAPLADAVLQAFVAWFWVSLVGYVSTGLFAAPLYCVVPEGLRGNVFAVTPLAGLAAAAPWLLLSAAFEPFGLVAATVAFAFGCVGGVAFVLIRGARRTTPG